jgi:hypothetical protein
MPLTGRVDWMTRHGMTGWAADSDADGEADSIPLLVNVNGDVRAQVMADRVRSRATPAAVAEPVRRTFEYVFDPPLSVFQPHAVEVRFATTGKLLHRGSKTFQSMQGRIKRPPAPLMPLLVTALGRSGTTLLMHKLSEQPQIVVAPRYPYEIKLLAYYSVAFRTLVANGDNKNSTDAGKMTSPKQRFFVGYNPFNIPNLYNTARDPAQIETFFEESVPAALASTFRDLVQEYYTILQTDQGKTEARYFAEKSVLHEVARRGPDVLFGSHAEIVLTRDPRDLLCSRRSFWKQDARRIFAELRGLLNGLLEIRREEGDKLFIRYEDLVLKPKETLEVILRHLGVEGGVEASAQQEGNLFQMHGTSENPAASVGRWQHDLSEEELQTANRAFQPFLEAFGYSIGPEPISSDVRIPSARPA